MNGSEIMLDAVNGIAPDLVDEAAGYRFKRNGTNALAWAAAACLMLGVGAAMAAALLPRHWENPAEQQTAEATETAEAVPTNTATETEPAVPKPTEEPRVVYASNEEFMNGSVIKRGELSVSEALLKAMEDEDNAGCLFAVKIMCRACDKEDAFIEAGHDRLFSDPVYLQFLKDFDEWEKTYELTEGELALVEKGASRREIALERFKEIWKSNNSPELAAKLDELEAQMDDWRANMTGLREYLNGCFDEERSRLEGMGYSIALNEYGQWCCKLTAEQINSFPADPGWGYKILWASDGEGFV